MGADGAADSEIWLRVSEDGEARQKIKGIAVQLLRRSVASPFALHARLSTSTQWVRNGTDLSRSFMSVRVDANGNRESALSLPFAAAKDEKRMTATIALFDDDRNILQSLSIALQDEGFVTSDHSDGEAAL